MNATRKQRRARCAVRLGLTGAHDNEILRLRRYSGGARGFGQESVGPSLTALARRQSRSEDSISNRCPMLKRSKSSSKSKSKRMLFGGMLLALLGTAIVLGFANRQLLGRKQDGGIAHVDGREARKAERADARLRTGMSALPAVPQTSAQF